MGILSLLAPASAPPAIREMQSMCQIDCDHDPLIKALNPLNPRAPAETLAFLFVRSISDQAADLLGAGRKSGAVTD
jgi:hypothetical protein